MRPQACMARRKLIAKGEPPGAPSSMRPHAVWLHGGIRNRPAPRVKGKERRGKKYGE